MGRPWASTRVPLPSIQWYGGHDITPLQTHRDSSAPDEGCTAE